jgi:hypothetical protein
MGSRLLPLSFGLAALLADAAGLHGAAFYLVLLAVPGAAAAAFVAAGDALEGRRAWPRATWTVLALLLLVAASAVRENAPQGAAVPVLATSALAAAAAVYALSLAAWLFEPLRLLRPRTAGVRAEPAADPR